MLRRREIAFAALVLAAVLGVLGLAPGPGDARPLTSTQATEGFPAGELTEGTTSSPEQCASLPFAVWVTVDGDSGQQRGDCIRYYAAGLKPSGVNGGANPDLLVFFHGDLLAMQNGRQVVMGDYERETPSRMLRDAALWSGQAGGLPVLVVARPGTLGSSGDHTQRRRPREVKLIDAALDAIKAKHGAQRLHLAGQSGGGHIVAAMLNRRRDVECAAIASGAVAVWKRVELLGGGRTDFTGYGDSYDPVDEVANVRRAPPPTIFVISDPEDRIVPFASQLLYVEKLVAAGPAPIHVSVRAPDPARHSLAHLARPAIRWCAQKVPPAEIKFRLETLSALGVTGD